MDGFGSDEDDRSDDDDLGTLSETARMLEVQLRIVNQDMVLLPELYQDFYRRIIQQTLIAETQQSYKETTHGP